MTQTDTRTLHEFEGKEVVSAKIEIPDAAGGLRDAMAVAPVELHHGEEGYITLHYRVKKVRFDPSSKDAPDLLARIHVLETLEATFTDADLVEEHVRENVDRVRKAIEEAKGIQRLDDALDDDEPDEDDAERAEELVRAHEMGLHPHAAVVGCTACDEREQDRAGDTRKDLS